MPNVKKKLFNSCASSILLAAAALAAPASATKPPPPPPPPPPSQWEGCSPWGSYLYDVDCCGYPDLIIPCAAPAPSDPVVRPSEEAAESSDR
jgi:hypothetical protein